MALLLSALAAAALSCPLGCSHAGRCVAGACVCEPPFGGAACSELAFDRDRPGAAALVAPAGSTTWGGSPIASDDGKSFYIFASLNRNSTIAKFSETGVIVAARASAPEGPYVLNASASYTLPPRDHKYWDATFTQNPVVTRLRDGTGFVLYYAGCAGKGLHWSMGNSSIGTAYGATLEELATRPRRPDNPVLEPMPPPHWEAGGISNPAVWVFADNSVLLAYRGTLDNGIAFASAPTWDGKYERLMGGKRFFIDMALEDPYLLMSDAGMHVIMHSIRADNCTGVLAKGKGANDTTGSDCPNRKKPCTLTGNVGAHAFAPWAANNGSSGGSAAALLDLEQLQLAPLNGSFAGGYNLSASEGSKAINFSHREEPKLLWQREHVGAPWRPTHLFNVVIAREACAATNPKCDWKYRPSHVHAQPLKADDDVGLRLASDATQASAQG